MTQCVYALILSQADFSANAVLYVIMRALSRTEGDTMSDAPQPVLSLSKQWMKGRVANPPYKLFAKEALP